MISRFFSFQPAVVDLVAVCIPFHGVPVAPGKFILLVISPFRKVDEVLPLAVFFEHEVAVVRVPVVDLPDVIDLVVCRGVPRDAFNQQCDHILAALFQVVPRLDFNKDRIGFAKTIDSGFDLAAEAIGLTSR